MTSVLLDTHVLLWWKAGGDRLSARARTAIARADNVVLSPVTFWEVAMLTVKNRISLDRDSYDWARDVLGEESVALAPLTPLSATAGALLQNFAGDPADRMLYATAREQALPFVSKDQQIRSYARHARDVKVIW